MTGWWVIAVLGLLLGCQVAVLLVARKRRAPGLAGTEAGRREPSAAPSEPPLGF